VLDHIKSAVSSYLNVYVSFGISSICNDYGSLAKMYRESQKALEVKFFSGTGIYYHGSGYDSDKIAVTKIGVIRQFPKLLKILGDSGIQEYNGKIDSFSSMRQKSKEKIQTYFYHLIQWLSTMLHTRDEEIDELVMAFSEKIKISETLDEVIEAFSGFVNEITNMIMKKRVLSKEVTEATHFIQRNYGSDINLPQVADYVKLSPNYLGNLFKKELQVNFIEYLNEFRIGKAKELLLGTYLKSYEIAERVGFKENTYFCKVFKKVAGMSPNEFRKHLMKEWSEELEDENLVHL
jgi:YesN/AraC family two-component response regulator